MQARLRHLGAASVHFDLAEALELSHPGAIALRLEQIAAYLAGANAARHNFATDASVSPRARNGIQRAATRLTGPAHIMSERAREPSMRSTWRADSSASAGESKAEPQDRCPIGATRSARMRS